MKKALIIHGWESNSKEHWFQEEKKILESKGYKVFVPDMPNTFHPQKDEWVKVVRDFEPDKESILIGHSLGAPTILRYLETAPKKVEKIFLIGAFAKDLGLKEVKNFVDEPFNWETIKRNAQEIFVINENNDPYVPLERGKEIAQATGGVLLEVEGNIHFDKMDLDLINSRL